MKKSLVFGIAAFILIGILALVFMNARENSQLNIEFTGKTIDLKSTDGLIIKADIYESESQKDPIILLYHQAGYSRGEYRPIAPKLNEMGFTCIAIDQRSGKEVNGVNNETFEQAINKGIGTDYLDAYPDLEAALMYAKNNYSSRKIIIWGSSYSASLVFILGAKYKNYISGIVSFSPGEYFEYENMQIKEYAKEANCPVFVSSAKNEYILWKEIFENISNSDKVSYIPESEGIHGSRALWEVNEGHEECWNAIKDFLNNIKER